MPDPMAKINNIIGELIYGITAPKFKFPGGLSYRYFSPGKKSGFRLWWCTWTTTKNENNKFLSFVYEWRGKRATPVKVREHKKRTDAKARALKLHKQRKHQLFGITNPTERGV